jgi:hypothetical protein
MALCLSASEVSNLHQQEQGARIAKAREAAEFISSREEDGKFTSKKFLLVKVCLAVQTARVCLNISFEVST